MSDYSKNLRLKIKSIEFSLKLLEPKFKKIETCSSNCFRSPKVLSKKYAIVSYARTVNKLKPLERIFHNPILENSSQKQIRNKTVLKLPYIKSENYKKEFSCLKSTKNKLGATYETRQLKGCDS
ncbi:hypothetical protein SteCoe_11878 [Stentor coeruleus]|uniref:Uncharacterized protein n=1 Tax=Stentor coeruleus TaxID=5963 RepID=A0A1R2CC62_9CILI|nr:hypothetical protein SteCoe_11878 [Stentor coeruleus]